MAIELFTGKPGAGKTHHAVQRAMAAIKAGRPVFISNMNGVDIAGSMPFEDPRKWMELPAGALLIVDEAQKFWRASRSMDIPFELQEAETHRHSGIDMLLTTQQPTYLLKHLRGLIMPHTHHERLSNGTTRTYKWLNRCVEDPESQSERDLSEQGVHVLTKAEFSRYKSTEQDTHKPGIPKRLIVVVAIAVTVVGMLWWVSNRVSGLATRDLPPVDQSASAKPSLIGPDGGRKAPRTPAEYMANLQPRDIAMPWSAPAFDDRKVVAKPEMYCITSKAGLDAQGNYRPASHTCITEQGTTVEMVRVAAVKLARHGGVYNPYREPERNSRQGPPMAGSAGAGQRPAAMTAGAVAVGSQASGEPVTAYGGFRSSGSAVANAEPL